MSPSSTPPGANPPPGGSHADASQQPFASPDPFELWRQVYEANERAWNSALERAMATPAFAESQGKMLETMLQAQKTVRDHMRTYLETINVPTREDIARLGELVVSLEEKVDQVLDRLDEIEAAQRTRPAATVDRPRPAPKAAPRPAQRPSAER